MTQAPTGWTTTGPKAKPIFIGDPRQLARIGAKMFEKAYAQLTFPAGSSNKYTLPGLVIALNTTTNKYVPWVAAATNGAGSDTAVGILIEQLELTTWDRMCAPIYHGEVDQTYVYTEENAIGTVPAAVKTALPDIYWRS